VSEGLNLAAESNSYPPPGTPPGTPPTTGMMLHATMDCGARDGEVEVATLLHAVAGTPGPLYRLEGLARDWKIRGPKETLTFLTKEEDGKVSIHSDRSTDPTSGRNPRRPAAATPPEEEAARIPATRWTFHPPGRVSAWTRATSQSTLALGTEDGKVVVLDPEGRVGWTNRCDAEVTALAFFEDDLIVGTRSGQVCRFDPEGILRWRHRCSFRIERPFWPWWFLETPMVAALAVGHDPASARDLIALGTGSTSLNFLDARTGSPIGDVVSRYGLPDRIRTHFSPRSGELRFLVGHSWLTCGSTLRAWSPPPPLPRETVCYERSVSPMGRSLDGWDTCGVVDFRVGPLVRKEPDRVVVLRHGALNQISVYRESNGDPLWDATLGGAPVALAVVPGESEASARCYVAEQFGWLVAFDGAGKRVAARRVAPSLHGMNADSDGTVVLWNLEHLYLARGGGRTDRYRLEGRLLGWVRHRASRRFMCLEQDQLVMKEIL